MSSTASRSSSPMKRGIITQKTARDRRSLTPGHRTSGAFLPKKDSITSKSAGPRTRQTRMATTEPRLKADAHSKTNFRSSNKAPSVLSSEGQPQANEPRRRLIRVFNMVRSFVRFTGGKASRKDIDSDVIPLFTPSVEATYQLEPDVKVVPTRIEIEVRKAVDNMLKNYEYDAKNAPKYSRALSSVVSDTMKRMNMPRYRFVVNVMIGEDMGQDLALTSRCLWDERKDNHVTVNYKGKGYFVVITVYAVYYD